jgi:DNA-binding response OmpR family regulator
LRDKKILIIDDDPQLRKVTQLLFEQTGAQSFTAANGEQGLQQFNEIHPDLVILDLMMPGISGFEVCRRIRQRDNTPIIMLTALDAPEEMVQGLDSGADDFVPKPFKVEVLLARARAVLRRAQPELNGAEEPLYQDQYLKIDMVAYKIWVNGEPVKLTPTEFKLLVYLIENRGSVCSFEQILVNVWGWEYSGTPSYVHVYVSHLRAKIEPDPKQPRYIITEHGVGYYFEDQN